VDSDLCLAVDEMAEGLVEARLGGSLYKKRVARAGQGKSGSYRTIVAFRTKGHAFFLFGFNKGDRSNIDSGEEAALKKLARELLKYDAKMLTKALKAGALIEVVRNG